jgi:hypothetical protein
MQTKCKRRLELGLYILEAFLMGCTQSMILGLLFELSISCVRVLRLPIVKYSWNVYILCSVFQTQMTSSAGSDFQWADLNLWSAFIITCGCPVVFMLLQLVFYCSSILSLLLLMILIFFFSYRIIVGLRSNIVVHFLGYESFCNRQVIHSFGCWCWIIHCAVAQYSNMTCVCMFIWFFFTRQKEIYSFVFDCIFQMWNSNRLLMRTSFLALDLYPSHRQQTVIN